MSDEAGSVGGVPEAVSVEAYELPLEGEQDPVTVDSSIAGDEELGLPELLRVKVLVPVPVPVLEVVAAEVVVVVVLGVPVLLRVGEAGEADEVRVPLPVPELDGKEINELVLVILGVDVGVVTPLGSWKRKIGSRFSFSSSSTTLSPLFKAHTSSDHPPS
eukprot:gb/GECG01005036.1/.p1 GENE.gb/GECG01005036.1/~~gb/GECG01005036.1/.p1  ORF type:complete len:160 (+),score=19.63 gb/GECG01005036.1/:1-480(+)